VTTTAFLTLTATRGPELEIEATIAAAKRGDPEAFAALRMTGDPTRAGELAQDVFVRVWERLGSFRGDSAFATWLHRLAVNVVLASRRAEGRRRARIVPGEDVGPGRSDGPGRPRDPGLLVDLERAVAALPTTLREVFVLHDVEGYPHGEIADLLEIPVGTCRSHLFHARRTLREALG
jgi:RNA polymerase sigma-70 factor (ECF subfamily)